MRDRDAEGGAAFELGDAGGVGDHHHATAARHHLLDVGQRFF
jgi:hypothetical protein